MVKTVTEREQELVKALEALMALHHDWTRGSAYITVKFEQLNNAAIAQARIAIAATVKDSQ